MAKKLPDLERMLSRIHGKTIKKADFCTVIAVRASRLALKGKSVPSRADTPMQSFESLMAGLKNLAELCSDFKSQGIPNLLESTPDLTELLQEIQELYDSDGAGRIRSCQHSPMTDSRTVTELLPVDGKDEEYDVRRLLTLICSSKV